MIPARARRGNREAHTQQATGFRPGKAGRRRRSGSPKTGLARQPPRGGGQREPSINATSDIVGVYDAIHRRRDVRGEFTGETLDEAALARVLTAAHAAPSVGLSQPWDFVLIESETTQRAFWRHVQDERAIFAGTLNGERAERFAAIKIDGVLDASAGLVVTYDPQRGAPSVLGRHSIADAGIYSVCLAIENLWLAATAEGWGVGWVSFYQEPFLRNLLHIPERIRPIAWLCLGPVSHLAEIPDLERHRWQARRPLCDALHRERWDHHSLPPHPPTAHPATQDGTIAADPLEDQCP